MRPNATPRRQPPPGTVNRGVNGYAWELWKLQQLGMTRELPVYVTESGWRHASTQAPSRDKDFATVDDGRSYVDTPFDTADRVNIDNLGLQTRVLACLLQWPR